MGNLIIGGVSPTTARVWVRGDKKSKTAKLRYRAKGTTAWTTAAAPLEEHRGFIAILDLAGLAPDTAYECDLAYQAGNPPPVKAGGFKTAPIGSRDMSFILGSCNWTRAPLDILDPAPTWEGIEALIGLKKPDLMIHCGDQIYSDVPSSPPPQFMDVRYYRELHQKAWKIKPTARVLAALPHYMILDDHEIVNDFFNGIVYAGQDTQAIRDAALAVYKEYQHSHNPQPYPLPALYFNFEHAGVKFFALDTRSERYVGEHAQIIGAAQMADLKTWLTVNNTSVKFVVTSIPFVCETRGSRRDKWTGFVPQRDELIDFIAANRIGRLVFLTGDMHCSCYATMTIKTAGGDLAVHEIMSSPINQFTGGVHAFLTDVTAHTAAGIDYHVELKEANFYGKHSNVVTIGVKTSGQVSWEVYRTKDVVGGPVCQGKFGGVAMIAIVWEFIVKEEAGAGFHHSYGPSGEWVALFRQHPGYEETTLLQDTTTRGRFLTIDRWESESQFHQMRRTSQQEYSRIDAMFEELTVSERQLGVFWSL